MKNAIIAILGLVLGLTIIPSHVSAVEATFEDDFEDYSVGSALYDTNGGSGWANPWGGQNPGHYIRSANCYSGLCVASSTGYGSTNYNTRTFTAASNGVLYIYMNRVNETNGRCQVFLRSGSTDSIIIYGASGNWTAYQEGGYSTMGEAVTLDQWEKLAVEWDATNQAGKFRYAWNDGATSSWKYYSGTAADTFDTLLLANDGDWYRGCMFDQIYTNPQATPPSTSVASVSDAGNILLYTGGSLLVTAAIAFSVIPILIWFTTIIWAMIQT